MRFERESRGDVDTLATAQRESRGDVGTLATARIPKDCWLALFARIL
jgi:hypothetical protein